MMPLFRPPVMRSHHSLSHGLLIVLVFVLVLCSSRLHAREITDKQVTLAVENELLHDQRVPTRLLTVQTHEGVVTLSGSVRNLVAKERAADIAETVKGVRSVVNRIHVDPPPRSDGEIRQDIRETLVSDPATESFEVDVMVQNGTATLTGQVDSWQEKRLCAQIAKGVRGVRDVQNDILVEYKASRSDTEIKADIVQRLAWDVRVEDTGIDVHVNNGFVTLTGTVRSAAEKTQAEADAWVVGVRDVDARDLTVDWRLTVRRPFDPVRSDTEIKGAIRDAFRYDPRVIHFNPDVEVNRGVVTLTGVVDNLRAKKAAEQDAMNTVGVRRVKNYLKIRRAYWPGDAEIQKRVREALLENPQIGPHDIRVSSVDGKVFLSGVVNTRRDRLLAGNIASTVKGVAEIQNNIEVRDIDRGKTDLEIKEDIEDELWWSPFVDSGEVTVTVRDGVAILTGVVDDWDESRVATENAYEGGACNVRNHLKVRIDPTYYKRHGIKPPE